MDDEWRLVTSVEIRLVARAPAVKLSQGEERVLGKWLERLRQGASLGACERARTGGRSPFGLR